MSTEDVALARMGFALTAKPTAEELAIQQGIDRTMRDLIADVTTPCFAKRRRRSPCSLECGPRRRRSFSSRLSAELGGPGKFRWRRHPVRT